MSAPNICYWGSSVKKKGWPHEFWPISIWTLKKYAKKFASWGKQHPNENNNYKSYATWPMPPCSPGQWMAKNCATKWNELQKQIGF